MVMFPIPLQVIWIFSTLPHSWLDEHVPVLRNLALFILISLTAPFIYIFLHATYLPFIPAVFPICCCVPLNVLHPQALVGSSPCVPPDASGGDPCLLGAGERTTCVLLHQLPTYQWGSSLPPFLHRRRKEGPFMIFTPVSGTEFFKDQQCVLFIFVAQWSSNVDLPKVLLIEWHMK